ncbi:hypothetical protein BOTBODRAFT_179279 [Botryobasidium botryosum FD-172 SS1]|uniref:CHCH domain-containing protein n=1 Tax=Botryobasidium botryosum (strain FD-172 SS1) TaxID=930990 RepID=A0A067MB44_BOTB1|nr:hypothetical protein BOTBODRAFT_179279 [Botryobasidium botryosum FD-172 SS1]
MPRQSRGRPAARPAPAAAPAQQTRSAHTAAYPSTHAAPPQTHAAHPPAQAHAQQGPGMMAQMAATAGSVAIGSTIGHGLSSMLFGGGGGHAAEQPAQAAAPPMEQRSGISCDFQSKEFTKCLETGDVMSCQWYLDQLKACQAAARPY